jgi:hypothetical protein
VATLCSHGKSKTEAARREIPEGRRREDADSGRPKTGPSGSRSQRRTGTVRMAPAIGSSGGWGSTDPMRTPSRGVVPN